MEELFRVMAAPAVADKGLIVDTKNGGTVTSNEVGASLCLLKLMGKPNRVTAQVLKTVGSEEWASVRNKAMARQLTLLDLREHFDKPIAEAAFHFGICTTLLKKICRKLGVTRWPCRQIKSLTKNIASMESTLRKAHTREDKEKFKQQLCDMKARREMILSNPSAAALKSAATLRVRKPKKAVISKPVLIGGMNNTSQGMEIDRVEEVRSDDTGHHVMHCTNEGFGRKQSIASSRSNSISSSKGTASMSFDEADLEHELQLAASADPTESCY